MMWVKDVFLAHVKMLVQLFHLLFQLLLKIGFGLGLVIHFVLFPLFLLPFLKHLLQLTFPRQHGRHLALRRRRDLQQLPMQHLALLGLQARVDQPLGLDEPLAVASQLGAARRIRRGLRGRGRGNRRGGRRRQRFFDGTTDDGRRRGSTAAVLSVRVTVAILGDARRILTGGRFGRQAPLIMLIVVARARNGGDGLLMARVPSGESRG